jgi:hypothetical protein
MSRTTTRRSIHSDGRRCQLDWFLYLFLPFRCCSRKKACQIIPNHSDLTCTPSHSYASAAGYCMKTQAGCHCSTSDPASPLFLGTISSSSSVTPFIYPSRLEQLQDRLALTDWHSPAQPTELSHCPFHQRHL